MEQKIEPRMLNAVWYTVTGAAAYTCFSTDTIYRACERGELQHTKVGGRTAIRLRREWLDAWLEADARGGSNSQVPGG